MSLVKNQENYKLIRVGWSKFWGHFSSDLWKNFKSSKMAFFFLKSLLIPYIWHFEHLNYWSFNNYWIWWQKNSKFQNYISVNAIRLDPLFGDEPAEDFGSQDSGLGRDLVQKGQTSDQSLLPNDPKQLGKSSYERRGIFSASRIFFCRRHIFGQHSSTATSMKELSVFVVKFQGLSIKEPSQKSWGGYGLRKI